MQGKVKWFNADKEYGFIAGTDAEYFLHISELADKTAILAPGDAVEFDVKLKPRGAAAVNVRLLAPVGKGGKAHG